MTRRPRLDALAVILAICAGTLAVSAPPSATVIPSGSAFVAGGPETDQWRSGAPETAHQSPAPGLSARWSETDHATGPKPSNAAGSDPAGFPSESPTPRPTRAVAQSTTVTTAASPRPVPTVNPAASHGAPVASGTPRKTPRPVPATRSTGVPGRTLLRATWYCRPPTSRCTVGYPSSGMYAAISPDLRAWNGRLVRVCADSACIVVRVIDCDCQTERGIDLYSAAFQRLAPLSMGELWVWAELA